MNDHDALEQQAVDAAINLDWDVAIALNKKILKLDKKYHLSCLLRLGFAYLQRRNFLNAKKYYKLALKMQSENQIARENLERIQILEKKGSKKTMKRDNKFDPNLFLEVLGKTRASTLLNLGQKAILAQLTVGVEVIIKPKKIKAEVRTKLNEYIGSLPDDLSKRLHLFIKAGSEYSCFIKEVSIAKVVVFIREEKKGKKVAKFSSFPKNVQSNMGKVGSAEDDGKTTHVDDDDDSTTDVSAENELERLAESLTHEDKDFLNFERDTDEDKDEE